MKKITQQTIKGTTSNNTIIVYFDGECWFCKHYARYVGLMKSHSVDLRNARNFPDQMKDFLKDGWDINEGMIVQYQGVIYHGAQAILFLEKMRMSVDDDVQVSVGYRPQKFYAWVNHIRKKIVQLSGKGDIL